MFSPRLRPITTDLETARQSAQQNRRATTDDHPLRPVVASRVASQIDQLAANLLTHLHRGGEYGYYWQKASKLSTWWSGDERPDYPTKRNLYFGVHPACEGGSSEERSQPDTIGAINCLFADFDAKDFIKELPIAPSVSVIIDAKDLDKAKAAALAHISDLPIAPSVVVNSGGGYHCYWLLGVPWLLSTTEERQQAQSIQSRWIAFIRADKAAGVLNQVLRVPGTLNGKYSPARPVVFDRCNLDTVYDLSELVAVLPPVEPPAPARPRPARPAAQGNDLFGRARLNPDQLYDLVVSEPSYRAAHGQRLMVHCGCGSHAHGDSKPSVEIIAGKDGRGRLRAYSAACRWHCANFSGRYPDGLDFVQATRGCSKMEAAHWITGDPQPAPRAQRLAPADSDRRQSDPAQRAAEAERKRLARRSAVEATMAAVEARAAADEGLDARARLVLSELIAIANGRDWCRPSVATLAERLNKSERTIQRALSVLEGCYLRTEGYTVTATYTTSGDGKSTPRRTFITAPVWPVATLQTDERRVTKDPSAERGDERTLTLEAGQTVVMQESSAAGVTAEDGKTSGLSPVYIYKPDLESCPESLKGGATSPTPPAEPIPPPTTDQAELVTLASSVPPKRAKGKKSAGLPVSAWPYADETVLETERERQMGMAKYAKNHQARRACRNNIERLTDLIAQRRDVGMIRMLASVPAPQRAAGEPPSIEAGGAVAYAGGAAFSPPGGPSVEALTVALAQAAQDAPPVRASAEQQSLARPSAIPRETRPATTAPALSVPLLTAESVTRPLPVQSSATQHFAVVKCDYLGNRSAYGVYWLAVGTDGETEPTMYRDDAERDGVIRWPVLALCAD